MKNFLLRTFIGLALAATALHPIRARAQSQSEMNQTAARDFEKADAQLNQVYEKALHTLDAEGQEKLKVAERAWVQFREAESALAADSERGGTLAPLMASTRSTELTQQRIADLKKIIKGE